MEWRGRASVGRVYTKALVEHRISAVSDVPCPGCAKPQERVRGLHLAGAANGFDALGRPAEINVTNGRAAAMALRH
jgi:hypothetical protein